LASTGTPTVWMTCCERVAAAHHIKHRCATQC
jgi:hypothetical protein